MEIQQFNQLIELYSERLYRMAYRMVGESHTAEDLVQDTFKSVWKGKAVYDPSMGNNQGAWLFKIMRRRIADFYRGDPAPITISSIEVGVPGYFEDSGFSDEVQEALNNLPSQFKEILLLVAVMEWTHQEVADFMKIPIGTVLSRVSRARAHMRKLLSEQREAVLC